MEWKKLIGIVLIIALVIGGVVWYSASQKANKEMLYTEGVAALDTGRYADAVQIFTELREREYKDSVILLKQAKEARIEELTAEEDWGGVLELLPSSGDDRILEAKIRWGESLAEEGRLDEALAMLEDRIESRYNDYDLNYAKGRAMMAAGEYALAEEHFRNMNQKSQELREALVECIYRQYLTAEENGDENELTELEKRAGTNLSFDEYEQWVYIQVGSIRHCAERGDYAGAAEALKDLRRHKSEANYPKLNEAADALEEEIVSACIREGQWDALYKNFQVEFSALAKQDEFLSAAQYLASTDRSALIGTEPDFNALIEALPERYSRNGEALFKELAIASGDPVEQFESARKWTREKGREYEFLSYAMDISAAAAAGGELSVPVKSELLSVLPSAVEQPGKDDGAFFVSAFRDAYGSELDFRASEPRPGYYMVLAADGCEATPFENISSGNLPRLETYAFYILHALAEQAGKEPAYSYRAVENPNTAALLIVMDSRYQRLDGNYYPKALIRPDKSYTGFVQVVSYKIYDARIGGIIGKGEIRAPIEDDIITGNTEGSFFWINVNNNNLRTAREGAEELRTATDAAVAEFCGK